MGLSGLDHELLLVRRGARSGAYTIVAVHSTALGPALGGCRLTTYAHPADAVADALRLAEGMTFKAAVAGVDLGGGKGVVCVEPGTELTSETRARDAAGLRRRRRVARRAVHHSRGRRDEPGRHAPDRLAHRAPGRPARGSRRARRSEPVHGARRARRHARLRRAPVRHRGPRRPQRRRRRRRARGRVAGAHAHRRRRARDRLGHRRVQAHARSRAARRDLDEPRRGDARRRRRAGAVRAWRARSTRRRSRCSTPTSCAAPRTTSSPTTRSPRTSLAAGSSTRRTSSPTRAA